MSALLEKRSCLLHYGGYWGILTSGSVVVRDYHGGKCKKVVYDGDELCFRDVKKDFSDLLKTQVDLDSDEGFRIQSVSEGMVVSINNDHSLLQWWKSARDDLRGIIHLFSSTAPVNYAPSKRQLRSTTGFKPSHFVAPRKLEPPTILPPCEVAVASQAGSGPQSVNDVVSEWSEALAEVDLDKEFEDNIRPVEEFIECEVGESSAPPIDLSDDCVSVTPFQTLESSDDEEEVEYTPGPKYGPTVIDEEEYWSDHSSIPSNAEFVPDEEECEFSSDGDGDDMGIIALGNDEPIHEGEETLEFLKMANDVYHNEDEDDELEDGGMPKDIEKDVYVGQQWPNMKSCRKFMKMYAMSRKFMYVQVKNDPTRFKVKCKDPSCEWWILCALKLDKFTVELRKMSPLHTCVADVDNRNCHAKSALLAGNYEEFVRTHPDCSPKMLAKEIFSREGIKVMYWVAWAARRRLLEKINGSYEEAFKMVPAMCSNLELHNEGSIIRWFKNEETDQFTGLFVAFKASLKGWVEGCRPVIGLDACFLKGKYGGACLSAMGLDAMNGLFPLAIYITTGEHKVSWRMFCSLIQTHVNKHADPITFMSDRAKGLLQSVGSWFPRANHRFCFRHMYKNFKADGNSGDYLQQMAWGAAKALKKNEHLDYMKVIEGESAKAYAWLDKVEVNAWARYAFDQTCKCDKITNNFSESFNAWILKIRDKPIVQFMDKYILALTALMYERRRMSRELEDGTVVPKVMHIIERYMKKYHKFTIEGVSDTVWLALSRHGKKYFVNTEEMTCTCVQWQLYGIPCIHAVAVLLPRREPWARYCSSYYSVESFRATYAGYIFPLDNTGDWEKVDATMLPPHDIQPGRPKKMRIRAEDEPEKSGNRLCTKCNGRGHNTRTCDRRNAGTWNRRNKVKKGKGKAKANSSEAGNGEVTGPTQGRQSLVRTELPLTLNAPVKKRGRGRPPKVAPTNSEPVIQVVPRANKKRIANTQHAESVTKPKRTKKNGIQSQP